MGGIKLPSLKGVGKSLGSEILGGLAHAFGAGKRAESAARNIGGEIGSVGGEIATPVVAGALLAKKGAIIRRRGKQKPVLAVVHTGETILPMGVKPTLKQKSAIVKRQKGKGNQKTMIVFH